MRYWAWNAAIDRPLHELFLPAIKPFLLNNKT